MIQIQGSATVQFEDGQTIGMGYAEKNGCDYEPIGKYLRDYISKEDMSIQAIENHLRTLSTDKLQEILNKNPSYVFFKKTDGLALTALGVPVTEGRTAAVDQRFFPKGGLAFLQTTKPVWGSAQEKVPSQWKELKRFVLAQDTGGAITGGGHLDLFWGSGDDAKRNAGIMKQPGKIFFLAPKPALKETL